MCIRDRYFDQWNSDVVSINENNKVIWSEDGTNLNFQLLLPKKDEYYILFNWWGVANPIISEKNVLLKAANGFIVKGNSADNRVDGRER